MSARQVDLVERVGATFIQAFLSVFIVSDMSTLRSAAVAGVAAVLALTKVWAKTASA